MTMNIDDTMQLSTAPDLIHLILGVMLLIVSFIAIAQKRHIQRMKSTANEEAVEARTTEEPAPAAPAAPPSTLTSANPDSALQLLGLLQHEARFIDFVKEDLSTFSDEEIGGVARVVHEGSKKTLENYFTFESIHSEDEETNITVPAGFNPSEVRLTGNVTGEAPFNGTLIHKGWRATHVTLPKTIEGHDATIIAPAEVEL